MAKRKSKKLFSKKTEKRLFRTLLYSLIISLVFSLIFLLKFSVLLSIQIGVAAFIFVSTSIIGSDVFDYYAIGYRFWRIILKRRWLYVIIFCFEILSNILACYLIVRFLNWFVTILSGLYLGLSFGLCSNGLVRKQLHRGVSYLSYKRLYECYVTKADYWEKKLQGLEEKRAKK